jgi:hypothetical protein
VNPIVNRPISPAPLQKPDQAPDRFVKSGASKFDEIRARIKDEADQPALPPEIERISPEQTRMLQSDLRRRLARPDAASADDLFRKDIGANRASLDDLTRRVNALPQNEANQPFRDRLVRLENQWADSQTQVASIGGLGSPGDLLKLQIQMYQLTSNLELMSKAVEQVNSGVKSILQTQV